MFQNCCVHFPYHHISCFPSISNSFASLSICESIYKGILFTDKQLQSVYVVHLNVKEVHEIVTNSVTQLGKSPGKIPMHAFCAYTCTLTEIQHGSKSCILGVRMTKASEKWFSCRNVDGASETFHLT